MKLLKNEYISTAIGKFSTILGTVITTVLLNRYLGPQLRGEYSLVINQMALIVGVLNLGLPQVYHYYYRKSEDDCKVFENLVMTQFVILLILSFILQFNVKNNSSKIIILLVPIVVFAQQLNIISLVRNLNKRNKNNVIVAIFNVLMWIYVYFFSKTNIYLAYLVYAAKEIFLCIKSLKIVNYKLEYYRFEPKKWISILGVSFLPMVTMLLNTMNYRIDTIILGYSVNLYELGLYSAGLSIAEMAWVIPDIFKEVMFNKTAKDDSTETISRLLRITFIINILMIITICIGSKLIIHILMGDEYLEAYKIVMIMFLGIPSMSFFKIINPVYLAKGDRNFAFKVLLYSVISNILLNFVFIPRYGIYGAAISSVISYSICGIWFLISFSKTFDINIKDSIILKKEDIDIILKYTSLKYIKK